MNHQLRKIETPQPQQRRANTNRRRKNKFRKFKENHERTENYIATTKKHRTENNQDGKGNINQV